ncbi:Cna B-type domain-containing protein [Listeria sp. FSL L7-1582]|uniref:Cna B-type domain-containing protein n=1 Tax=Listeria portnoyi TaxID=2713504 RepID=UPI00164E5AD9|nr:Cna B-type domain-containing protein [Listeria portnoyi]MBC6309728.1 Cna B-type domain-containing protein [Listeria portnoyi]
MKQTWKKTVYFLMAVLVVLSQSLILTPSAQAKQGDDPGITISGPDTINSRQQVELTVTLASSAGKLNKDGYVTVSIPSSVVADKKDILDKLVIGNPFLLEDNALETDANGDYLLTVHYDHTKIDQQSATGQTFTVKFKAPRFYSGNPDTPDSVTFHDTLYKGNQKVSSDQAISDIATDNPGLPLLEKRSTQSHKDINGESVSLMSTTNPSSNIFAILVNYSRANVKNAKLVDTTPKNTELADPGKYITASGDATPLQHIRIAKVTAWGDDGFPTAWNYVTEQFSGKIETSADGFSIDLGDLTEDDSYVVMYAEKVDDDITADTFGVRYNTVDLTSNDAVIKSADAALTIDTSDYNYTTLTKAVDKSTISTADGGLTYSLTLGNMDGTVPAGTRIVDPLPDYITFNKTIEFNNHFISDATYDADTNTLEYTLLRNLNVGQKTTVKFLANYSNPDARAGDEIVNRSYIDYAGTDIYSNSITTTVENSAYLVKKDATTGNPLAGAVFKIVDAQGMTVRSDLTSNDDGMVRTGILRPGEYSFVETKAPDLYLLDTTPVPFTVTYGDTTTVTLNKTNELATSVAGQKTWDDNGDKDGKRPASITIDLYQNGKMIQSKVVTADDDWAYSFDQLPKLDANGKDYDYTLQEETVENYMTIQDGYNFTNVYVPDLPVPPTPPTPPLPTPPVPVTPTTPVIPTTPVTPPANTIIVTPTSNTTPTTPTKRISKETRLPSTGDAINQTLIWTGGILLLALGALVSRRKKA